MQRSRIIVALACGLAAGVAGSAGAGAPQPETRSGDFVHVCQGGANKGLPCTVPNQAADCPGSSCVAQPLTNATRGTLTIIEDVTERVAHEAELRERVDALKEADRRKDEFLAMLAHELRNPLAPIRNALHIVQMRGLERRQAVREAWEMIERQVENLVRLVDDLLDVSRISQGKINLQKEPIKALA